MKIHLLRAADFVWHHGIYQLTASWADWLHLFMHRTVCTPVADWEVQR